MDEIKFAYGQERDLNCTDAELDIFHIIRSVCDDDNCDASRHKGNMLAVATVRYLFEILCVATSA